MQNRKSFHSRYLQAVITLCLFVSFPVFLSSQIIPFVNYTNQNGLPQSTVNDILQDHEGYLWFATQVGAARFDGHQFEYFQGGDGLVHNWVNCMLVDSQGSIWFGTEGGLSKYDGKIFCNFTENDGLVSNRVDRLLEDKQGNIWVGTAYGLSVLTADTLVSYKKGKAITDNSIQDMFLDSRGRVHVATVPFPGLTIFEDPFNYLKSEEEEIIRDIAEDRDGNILYATQGQGIRVNSGIGALWLGSEQGLSDEIVLSLMIDNKGELWCGTYYQGMFRYRNGRFEQVSFEADLEPEFVELMEDRNHRIWARSFGEGIYMLDGDRKRFFDTENTLVHDAVNGIFEDSFGNIWIATKGGVSKYGRALFEIHDMETGLPDNLVQALLLDSKGRLWCGTNRHLGYWRGDRYFPLGEARGFHIDASPLSFAETESGGVYIGSDRGLWHYNGRYVAPIYRTGEEKQALRILSLCYTDEHELWCATDTGVIVYTAQGPEFPRGRELFNSLWVTDIIQVKDRMYCATEKGVSVMDMEGMHLENYTVDRGLPNDVCEDLVADYRGNIWVATDGGLARIQPLEGLVETIPLEGSASGTCYFVAFSDSTSLWIGTERGVHRLDISSMESRLYDYEDGFRPMETSVRTVTGNDRGELWMGSVAGLVYYCPRYDRRDPVSPELVLRSVTAGGDPIAERAGQRILPYKRNSLVFEFTGIQTTVPSRNRFAFMLEGLDEQWSKPVTDRSVSYWKIPSGDYVFRLKAYNSDGVSSEELSYAFSIKPPFWKTVWFIILEVILGILMVYGFVQFRERQLIREKRILEHRVKVRTKEIEEQKAEIEAQRDEIAGQNKEITSSIQYARHIQTAVLPGKVQLHRLLPEHFVFLKPRDIVSGDFFWVEEKGDRIIACAADCTGHGVPGAFMSLLGLTFLNEIVNRDGILKASEILDRLRSYIIKSMSHKDEQARDGMDLALVVIDPKLRQVEYAGAYNPLLIVRNGEIIEYKADKMPIGKHVGEERPFTNHRISIEDGDILYMFSDGFPDQFGGKLGSKYKSKPFRRFLLGISGEDLDRQEELLREELERWMNGQEQVDDILVMGLRLNMEQL